MKTPLLTTALAILTGCTAPLWVKAPPPEEPPIIVSVGYGTMNPYSDYPEPQQHLLAIRAAKLDAYRGLAEEVYGTEIRGQTTVRDMAVQNDSYRSYVDAIVRGAKLRSVNLKAEGIYEAEVELQLTPWLYRCLREPVASCYGSHRAYVPPYPLGYSGCATMGCAVP